MKGETTNSLFKKRQTLIRVKLVPLFSFHTFIIQQKV